MTLILYHLETIYGRFLSTLLPTAGASICAAATFFPAALIPTPFLTPTLGTGGTFLLAFVLAFTTVVPVEMPE